MADATQAVGSTDSVIKWCEIAPRCSRERFTTLSLALNEAGCKNAVEFIEVEIADFAKTLERAKNEFDQIRLGGVFCEEVCKLATRMPSGLLTHRTADAVVRTRSQASHDWWPRNFFADGVSQMVAQEVKNLDFSGSVFILGANALARAVIGALVRVGFARFNISDPNDQLGETFVAELAESYFNAQFNFVPRHLITQLPGIHSFAVNALDDALRDSLDDSSDGEASAFSELFYFNFLKSSGVWLDLTLVPPNSDLEAEARTVGAWVQSGYHVYARVDAAWAEACFQVKLDRLQLAELLRAECSRVR